MRRFNSGMVERFLSAAGLPDDAPIESKMVSNAIRSAQTQVEAQNFEMRKNVLKYDDVMNRQRTVVYGERRMVLEGADIKDQVARFVSDTLSAYIQAATAEGYAEDWDLETLFTALKTIYPISFTISELEAEVGSRAGLDAEYLTAKVVEDCKTAYAKREEALGAEVMRELERKVLLSVLDRKWREHLYEMDYLQEGIGLRAMAQRDPLVEYQKEGFDLFAAMMDGIKEEIAGFLFNIEVTVESSSNEVVAPGLEAKQLPTTGLQYTAADESGVRTTGDVSRNAPCPCGSGKKFKRCHGGAA
jgi:preprotein translocase subunit SecA